MLAINSKLTATILMIGLLMFVVGSSFGQQTPSQRYQPVHPETISASQPAPPSVHLPPQQIQRLGPGQGSVNYNLSDSPRVRTYNDHYGESERPQFEEPVMRGNIRQVNYQVDANGEPEVPSILLGSRPSVPKPPVQRPAFGASPITDSYTPRTPNDFSAAMSQVQNKGPRIAPQEIQEQQQSISQQMAEPVSYTHLTLPTICSV